MHHHRSLSRKKTLSQTKSEKIDVKKKKARKQRKAAEKATIAEKRKNVIKELKETFEARESPFQHVDTTKCSCLLAHEISVQDYKDPTKMFQDKKVTITNKITVELQKPNRFKMVFWAYCLLFQGQQENTGNILQQPIRHIIR